MEWFRIVSDGRVSGGGMRRIDRLLSGVRRIHVGRVSMPALLVMLSCVAGLTSACRQQEPASPPGGAAQASPAAPASSAPAPSSTPPAPGEPAPGEAAPASSTAAGAAAAADASAASAAEGDGEGEHEHKAPHGGALVELGEEYAHLELVLNAQTGTLTAYALDGEAERPVRLAQPAIELTIRVPQREPVMLKLEAVASALTGESVGDASQFTAASPLLAQVTRFEGIIASTTIRGREFTAVSFRYPEGTEH